MKMRVVVSMGLLMAFAPLAFAKGKGIPAHWPSQRSDNYEEIPESEMLPPPPPLPGEAAPQDVVDRPLGPTERLITVLGTNDIHGAIETDEKGKGGMALWGGIVQAIRQGLEAKHGKGKTGVVLLDGGDQYQGTLISAHTEGQTIIQQMRLVGYDGIVPGNHDYDFGPMNPPVAPGQPKILNDQVFGQIDRRDLTKDPRGVIRLRANDLRPPLDPRNPPLVENFFVSANTFVSNGIFDTRGNRMQVTDPVGCKSAIPGQVMDFNRSVRPNEGYITPFRILKDRGGLTIAVIGLDTHETPATTNVNNILDLCFADEAQAYLATRAQIEALAAQRRIPTPDLYFITTHNGDPATGPSTFLKPLLEKLGNKVDAVVAGHTHQANRVVVGNVHAVQSGANGQHFGRIDLIYDSATKKVVAAQSANFIEFGVALCDPKAARYCRTDGRTVSYENQAVTPLPQVQALTAFVRRSLESENPRRVMGVTTVEVKADRIRDSALGEVFTDAMKAVVPGAQVALTNNGGLRTGFPAGKTITFEDLFRLMPFNNHLKRGMIPAAVLLQALQHSAESCGQYPGLSFSGIQVTFRRDCTNNTQVDPNAKVLSAAVGNIDLLAPNAPAIDVLAPDFLAGGGDSYLMFRPQPWKEIDSKGNPLGDGVVGGIVLREALADLGGKGLINWNKPVDHRWRNVNAQQD